MAQRGHPGAERALHHLPRRRQQHRDGQPEADRRPVDAARHLQPGFRPEPPGGADRCGDREPAGRRRRGGNGGRRRHAVDSDLDAHLAAARRVRGLRPLAGRRRQRLGCALHDLLRGRQHDGDQEPAGDRQQLAAAGHVHHGARPEPPGRARRYRQRQPDRRRREVRAEGGGEDGDLDASRSAAPAATSSTASGRVRARTPPMRSSR